MDSFSILQLRAEIVNTQAPGLRNITTALLVLATFFVCLRFLSRYLIGSLYGSDDWIMLGALASAFGAGGLNYGMLSDGLGKHSSVIALPKMTSVLKQLVAFECVYVTGVLCNKVSVLFMYLRIFPSRGFRITAAIIGSTVVGWWLAIVLVSIFQCHPIWGAWRPWDGGTCINLRASFIGNAIPNILSDIAILCMPVHQVLKLRITNMQKAMILFMFLLGSFVLFASIYRFTLVMKFDQNDTTYTLAPACTWCVVETACGTISGCLPTLRPVMMKISRKFGSMPSASAGTKPSGGNSRGPTELVTFGGSGAVKSTVTKTNGQFTRLQDENKYGASTPTTQSDHQAEDMASSDDEHPLNKDAIRVQVQREIEVVSSTASVSNDESYAVKYGKYRGV